MGQTESGVQVSASLQIDPVDFKLLGPNFHIITPFWRWWTFMMVNQNPKIFQTPGKTGLEMVGHWGSL